MLRILRTPLAALSLVLAGMTPASAQQVEDPVLNLHFQNNNVFMPHAVAIEKGWFREAGFTKVDRKAFTAGALAGEALLAGEIQAWMPGNVPVISMRHNALPVVVVGNICSVYEKVVVRPDAGVENAKDLENVRIGLLQGSTASAVLDNLATHYGLDQGKLEVVNLPPPEQITSLAANEVQAVIVWEPVASKAKEAVNGRFVFDSNISRFESDNGTPFAASHTLVPIVFTEEFLAEKPKTATAIVSVLVRATEYVMDPANRDEVVAIFAKMTERTPESIAGQMDEFFFNPSLDQKYLDDMRSYTAFLEKAGRISGAQDPLTYTDTSILESIDPKLVKIEGGWKP